MCPIRRASCNRNFPSGGTRVAHWADSPCFIRLSEQSVRFATIFSSVQFAIIGKRARTRHCYRDYSLASLQALCSAGSGCQDVATGTRYQSMRRAPTILGRHGQVWVNGPGMNPSRKAGVEGDSVRQAAWISQWITPGDLAPLGAEDVRALAGDSPRGPLPSRGNGIQSRRRADPDPHRPQWRRRTLPARQGAPHRPPDPPPGRRVRRRLPLPPDAGPLGRRRAWRTR